MTMTATEPITLEAGKYHEQQALSFSGMKTLAISPLHYWHRYLNPERPKDEPTPEMMLGTALHCAVLEPDSFEERFARPVEAAEYPGCLVTVDDLKAWLRERGEKTAGVKAELIERVAVVDPDQPIFDLIKQRHDKENAGKTLLRSEDWRRVTGMADALLAEPRLAHILRDGKAEQSFFVKDPETGVPLKARMDWVAPACTLDLKTFSQYRGKSIERAVADAIYYEGYYIQAYFYSWVRMLAEGDSGRSAAQHAPEYVLAFVESEQPHATALRSLRPRACGEVNLYWEQARQHVRSMIQLYAVCLDRFGDAPWRTEQEVQLLTNEDIPQLAY